MRKLAIGLDVDDTVVEFTSLIVSAINEKFGKTYSMEDIDWGFPQFTEEEKKYAFSFFSNTEFYLGLKPRRGAVEFIKWALSRGHEVFFVTATPGAVMTARAQFLKREFPMVPESHYYFGEKKEKIKLDIMFDDRDVNIMNSTARIPVLVNYSWNRHVLGAVRAASIDDFYEIVIDGENGLRRADVYRKQQPTVLAKYSNKVIVLVGPSGSGKTAISELLSSEYGIKKVVTSTTRAPRSGEQQGVDYNFCSKEYFEREVAEGNFLEHIEYSGNYYGTPCMAVDSILESGNSAVLVMDGAGAAAIQKTYGERAVCVFVYRPEIEMIKSVIERMSSGVSLDDTALRLKQMRDDYNNARYCPYSVQNTVLEEAAKEIMNISFDKISFQSKK